MVLEPGTTAATTPEFHVLGPLRVVVHGIEVPIATRRQRALVTLLVMSVGRVVPAERLVDQLWDGTPPPQGAVTLRSYVSNVRQALGGAGGMGSVLVTRGQGYCLEVPPDSVDAVRLERFAQEGREQLRQGRADEALRAFDASVATWSGDPLAEVADHEAARSAVAQLTETYLGALEGRFESLLALGRHADALAGLEAFATEHPLREQPRALLMLALYRSGRTPEALEVHRTFRTLLRDELGLDPSARLDELQRRILAQDTVLAAPRSERPAERITASASGSGLVGRDREMSVLTSHLQALVSTGTGALVLLSGEPGIGKTALLGALERQASRHGVRTFRGRSLAPSGAPAFWPWLQIIEAVAAELDEDALRRATSGSARPVAQLSSTIAERTGLGQA